MIGEIPPERKIMEDNATIPVPTRTVQVSFEADLGDLLPATLKPHDYPIEA
jgi:hypothetical protein